MFLIDETYWQVRKTRKKGRGVFTKKQISKGTVIGDYVGNLLHLEEINFEKEKENLYLMYYDDELGIYPNLKKPGVHLLNHSHSPNCWIKRYKNHTIVFALKDITKGEELTISYLLPPKKGCKNCTHQCLCQSTNCTGTMHLTEVKYRMWQNFQKTEKSHAKGREIKKEKVLKLLTRYPKVISKKYISKIERLNIA